MTDPIHEVIRRVAGKMPGWEVRNTTIDGKSHPGIYINGAFVCMANERDLPIIAVYALAQRAWDGWDMEMHPNDCEFRLVKIAQFDPLYQMMTELYAIDWEDPTSRAEAELRAVDESLNLEGEG